MHPKTTLKSLLAAGVAVTALAAPLAAQAEVKIGFLGGFTGPIESLTPPIFAAAELAVKHVNEQGGILASEQLTMPSGDSTCADATAAANAADRLVNSENVTAAVGPLCSGAFISAANNAAIPGGMVLVSPSATAPTISEIEDNDLLYRTTPSDAYQGEVMARLIQGKGIDTVAVTYVNNDYGKGLADAFATAFEGLGGTVTANEAHEDGKADYRAEIGSLASSGAEWLGVMGYADGSGQTVVRQAIEGGDFLDFFGGDGMISQTFVDGVGADNLSSFIGTRTGTPDVPGAAVYAGLAEAEGLDPNATFASQAYDAAFLLALAIQKNGSADREGLAAALRDVASAPGEVILPGEWEKAVKLISEGADINYEGASGAHEFDAAGDVPGVIVEMKVEGGAFVDAGVAE